MTKKFLYSNYKFIIKQFLIYLICLFFILIFRIFTNYSIFVTIFIGLLIRIFIKVILNDLLYISFNNLISFSEINTIPIYYIYNVNISKNLYNNLLIKINIFGINNKQIFTLYELIFIYKNINNNKEIHIYILNKYKYENKKIK
jgi:hypothetical protein